MKRALYFVVLLALAASLAFADDSLDRIVATVNRHPILASDLDTEAHFEALQQGKAPDALDESRRAVLDRIVERELVCQQISENFVPQDAAIDARIAEIRAEFPHVKSAAQWLELLDRYDLDQEDLRDAVRLQLQVLHFLEVRLRPTVRVDSDEISDYYDNQLLPKLKNAGAKIDPLDSVKQKIEEVLLQQKMTTVFNAWVANLRSQANIRILDPSLAPPAKSTEKDTRASQ